MEHRVKSHRGTKDVEPKTTGSDLCVLQTQGLQETAAQSQWVTKYIKSYPDYNSMITNATSAHINELVT